MSPIILTIALAATMSSSVLPLERVDCTTMTGKVLFGYQGWFRTPNDGSTGGWSHWSRGVPSADSMTVDLYPDLSELSPRDLCPVPGLRIQGKPAYLFSSFNAKVVMKHFEWMKSYGLDGVLVQRFVTDIAGLRKENDHVLRNVIRAAEETGRTFAIEYDMSGANPKTVVQDLEADWLYLVKDLKVTASKQYLFHQKKPVVSIWGFAFAEPNHPPTSLEALKLVDWFRAEAKVTLVGGTPGYWRSQKFDTDSDPGWAEVFRKLDAIQPWTVGRFANLAGVDRWAIDQLKPDRDVVKPRGQIYLPVIFPGFSWHNLNPRSPQNQIPRLGGKFLWRQAKNALDAGTEMLKIAMFDEVNEGTAMFKAASRRADAPGPGYWLTLDADGEQLPNDWFLRLAGAITQAMHHHRKLPDEIPKSLLKADR